MKRMLLMAAMLALGAGQAAGQVVKPSDPDTVVNALQENGLRAELDTDSVGDPLVLSSAGGFRFGVFFYGCEDGSDCSSFQFQVAFETDGSVSTRKLNEWNAEYRYTKAYNDDDGDTTLVLDVTEHIAGVNPDDFREMLDIWDRHISRFAEHIDFE